TDTTNSANLRNQITTQQTTIADQTNQLANLQTQSEKSRN
ncbi:7879_t:CDS:1, partial [Scutellospora calospora]